MTLEEFWDHVEATKGDDVDERFSNLLKRLTKLQSDEIIDFDYWWHKLQAEAYKWNLWGAAYLINGGCSDDGFIDFRSWLLLKGRRVFESALADPDSLANVMDGTDEASYECYPGFRAWFAATGVKENKEGYAAHRAAYESRHPDSKPPRDEDMGDQWDFDDHKEIRKRLPRLAKMYLDNDD